MAKIENLVDEGWGADKNLFVHFYLTVNIYVDYSDKIDTIEKHVVRH